MDHRLRGSEGKREGGRNLLELCAQELFMGKVAFARVLKGKELERKRSEQSCVWKAAERQSFQKHPVSDCHYLSQRRC